MMTLSGFLQIFKKEMKTYFISPIAYIVIGIFVIATGLLFFFFSFFFRNQASMRDFFGLLPGVFIIIVPLITMHLFSEEVSAGSYEMLLTLPIRFLDIIVGKFFAALTFIAICLLPTVSFAVSISFLGDLDWGPVVGGYIGALFLGAAYSAIGLLTSALSRNQIIAFIGGLFFCGILWFFNLITYIIPPSTGLGFFFQYISSTYHFESISRGIIDSRDMIYFVSICFLGLYLTKLVMEERK